MPSKSKVKGNNFERWIVNFFENVTTTPEYQKQLGQFLGLDLNFDLPAANSNSSFSGTFIKRRELPTEALRLLKESYHTTYRFIEKEYSEHMPLEWKDL